MGDQKNYSIIPTKYQNTYTDKISLHIIKHIHKKFITYPWEERASDERQYGSPGIEMPIVTLCRTKPGNYKEYHTSLDKLGTVVTPRGLYGGFNLAAKCLQAIEKNFYPIAKIKGEPFLSKRKLYPEINDKVGSNIDKLSRLLINMLSWCDGKNDLIDIAERLGVPVWELYEICDILIKNKLIKNYN